MSNKKAEDKKVNITSFMLVALIIIGILAAIIFLIDNNTSKREPHEAYIFEEDRVCGIDVSEYNKEIDWQTVKQTQQFAFIRVGCRGYGNGEIIEDKYARENLKNANAAGIAVGVYFYSQAINEDEAREEADFVYDIIKKYTIDLPVIIDFEYPTDENGKSTGRLYAAKNDKKTNTEIINAFMTRLEKKGYSTGVYASSSVYFKNINCDKLNENSLIWVADYNTTVVYNIDYDIWQYSKTGKCDGVSSTYVDLNYWYKNR